MKKKTLRQLGVRPAIGYIAERPEGLDDLRKSMKCFQDLARVGWYDDELEEMGRIVFNKLGKVFDIRPPVAAVDWDKLTNRRGVSDD